jgi:hypothetical protein
MCFASLSLSHTLTHSHVPSLLNLYVSCGSLRGEKSVLEQKLTLVNEQLAATHKTSEADSLTKQLQAQIETLLKQQSE